MIVSLVTLKIIFSLVCINFDRISGVGEGDDLMDDFFENLFQNNSQNLKRLKSADEQPEKQQQKLTKKLKIEIKEEEEEEEWHKEKVPMGETIHKIKSEPNFDQNEIVNRTEKLKFVKNEPKMGNDDHFISSDGIVQAENGSDQQQNECSSPSQNDQNDYSSDQSMDETVHAENGSDQQQNECSSPSQSDQNDSSDQSMDEKQDESENERKLKQIEKFDKMRKAYWAKNGYKKEERMKVERKIAGEMGIYRTQIYKWKKELGQKAHDKRESEEETKKRTIYLFEKIKQQMKDNKLYICKYRRKIEQEIATKLGTYRNHILKWKKEFGIGRGRKVIEESDEDDQSSSADEETNDESHRKLSSKLKGFDDEQKLTIINEFEAKVDEIKQQNEQNYKTNRTQIQKEIAQELGICRSYIWFWKRELGLTETKRKFSKKDEKLKIIEKFDKKKAQILTKINSKVSVEVKKEIEKKIAQKFGVEADTIYQWKFQLGLLRKRIYTQKEKEEMVRKFRKLQRETPRLSDEKIAKMLGICAATAKRWEKQLEKDKKEMQ